ncbi:MAG: phycobiliprotein lyase [Rivularia sp. ALOHA_DT_140]|nr:phycobiliprotein lyase [Rivularia sp. ALOHA_DT_140]
MDAITFFQQSAGQWRSSRTTHHLAFKRSEIGESNIEVKNLEPNSEPIIALCKMHEIDPSITVGGSRVSWLGTMSWDKTEDENHQGNTVFAIVPDPDNPTKGRLLRERGYAEIVPVVGRFHMDEQGALVLTTEYDTMSSIERFWFNGPNMRMRTSTVKRFGGFNSASFCIETRVDEVTDDSAASSVQPVLESKQYHSVLGW